MALAEADDPEVHRGLGRALWWLQEIDGAVSHMERAYAAFRDRSNKREAAMVALWLSREYRAVHGNWAAANGWHARAEGLLGDLEPGPEHGWLALRRAERADDPTEIRRHAEEALKIATDVGDRDLEAAALARLGYGEVAAGEVEAGTVRLDEAMAAATGGDVKNLETIGDVTCTAIAAFEMAADWQRIEQWGQVLESWIRTHDHVPVLGFCYACCAEMFLASGEWAQAEGMLVEGLTALQAAGHRSRCVHPAAKLAELRVMQGRLEEAEQLLAGFEELPEAAHALASLHLARGDTALAAALLLRRLNAIGGDNVLAEPFLSLHVEVYLAQGDAEAARAACERIAAIAGTYRVPRISAAADLARGRVGVATGEPDASGHLESALRRFSGQGMALQAARARLELARALATVQPEVAAREARVAAGEFERLGAPRDADAAAALLRKLGVGGRTGPKKVGLLSRREQEVLRLLAEGLTNAEIAARLYLSTKTVGHHVSNVLAKLGVRTRGEAGAWAIRHLGRLPEPDRSPK